MLVKHLHEWNVTPSEAIVIQLRLAYQVDTHGVVGKVRRIAGVDISPPDAQGMATGVVVVVDYPGMEIVEISRARAGLTFAYVPGLLSFREIPLLAQAFERLSVAPDLVLVDGQGYAHPRRLGIASHLGLMLDIPTIGCAKSRLCGEHRAVGPEVEDHAMLRQKNEIIGVALRTRKGCNPVYVSVGHKTSLTSSVQWTLNCGRGYRVPEPTRLAHLAAAGRLDMVGSAR